MVSEVIDFTKGAAWMRGAVIPIAEATIGVNDWGVTRSDITYDVVPVWKGGFFRLEDYLDRFEASMASLRLDVGMSRADIRGALNAMVARSGLRDSYVAMVASRGVPLIPGNRDPRTCANHFYAWCVPYIHVIPQEVAAKGASVWIAKEVRRIPEDSVNPRAKNYHWGDITQGLFEAKDRGFETVVLLDHAGNVTEGPGFNVFAVKDGRVITPERGVLHGITRRTVLDICAERGVATETRALPLAELLEADEVFLSTSGGGAVPVTRVDDRIFSNGAPGPVAVGIRDGYWDWIMQPEMRQEIDYAVH
jgi:branched-chain amino acid aminotransferase